MEANISDIGIREDDLELSEDYQEVPPIYVNVPIASSPLTVTRATGGSRQLRQNPTVLAVPISYTQPVYAGHQGETNLNRRLSNSEKYIYELFKIFLTAQGNQTARSPPLPTHTKVVYGLVLVLMLGVFLLIGWQIGRTTATVDAQNYPQQIVNGVSLVLQIEYFLCMQFNIIPII